MDLSAAQHQLHSNFPHQESQSPGSTITDSKSAAENQQQQPDQKKPRPPEGEPQKCPRCESTNTKFCYYNNYSLTQPRYFCKCCRRYWTKGGTLRNVPVGGGCRKSSKRASSSSSSPSPCHKRVHTRDTIITSSAASASNQVFSGLHHGYGAGMGGFGFDALMGNANFTDCDAGGNFLGHPMSFLQELHYGNGGSGLMFQGNFWDYDETAAGNSNCVSGISDDVANLAPYDDLLSSGVTAVKQEINDSINGGLWGQPWQNSINADLEPLRENWNGLAGNSAWGLLNTPALM